MQKIISYLFILIVILATFSVSARPTEKNTRQKRQSDQRLAELETLLALQKYGRHRVRPDRKVENQPGYGVVDFNLIGRRKKSTRFYQEPTPQEEKNRKSLVGLSLSQSLSDSDPPDNEKINNLISFPASFLIEDPSRDFDISPHK